MFKKLYKQIFNSIFWLAFVFAAILSAVSGYAVMRNLYNVYNSMSEGSVRQAAMDGNNYLGSVVNFTRSTAQSSDVVLALTEGRTENVSRALTALINSSSDVAGAVLYGVDGQVFYSTGVGDVPSLSRLQEDDRFDDFFRSDRAYFVLLRTSNLPSVYNSAPYDASQGVVSCVSKVYDGEQTAGYLFADILSRSLFANVLSVTGVDDAAVALVTPSATVVSQPFLQDDRLRNLYFTVSFAGDGDFVFCLSLKSFYSKCGVVLAVLLAADVVCDVAAALVARRVAAKVTEPLDKLRQTMQNENLLA